VLPSIFGEQSGGSQYQTLGTAEEGWSQVKAEQALRHVMADVERGAWRPPSPEPVAYVNPDPGFHRFASEWFEATKGEWQAKTRLDYEWQLAHHLLPVFRNHTLSQITVREIDRYRQEKVAEGQAIRAADARGKPLVDKYVDKRGCKCRRPRRPLSATSINKTITRLGQILEVAVEYGLIETNPAKGRRRRLKTQKVAPIWLDRPDHIEALLDADASVLVKTSQRVFVAQIAAKERNREVDEASPGAVHEVLPQQAVADRRRAPAVFVAGAGCDLGAAPGRRPRPPSPTDSAARHRRAGRQPDARAARRPPRDHRRDRRASAASRRTRACRDSGADPSLSANVNKSR
jgi:hypothetical protein